MDRFDRIYQLDRVLRGRRTAIPRRDLQARLECSRATVQRAFDDLRELGAPVIYDREANGYRYAAEARGSYELPGLWFNAAEVHALLVLIELLDSAQPGFLSQALAPIRARIEDILRRHGPGRPEFARRIRILPQAQRTLNEDVFRGVASAVVQRKKLRVLYHGRARDATTERWLSPQRLVHYRANWYLDAWCHLRRALRSFSLDRLHVAEIGTAARNIPEEQLDAHYASSYGIFAGAAKHVAVLRFSAEAARWVADEQWHPRQSVEFDAEGRAILHIPYGDPRELLMDIRKHGPDVEVLGPPSLRQAVAESHAAAAALYQKPTGGITK